MELRVPIADLAVLLGSEAATLDSDGLRAKLADFYGFLPDSAEVRVDRDVVVLSWPDATTSNKAEAERLAQKAAQ